jgi:hypothetical protein
LKTKLKQSKEKLGLFKNLYTSLFGGIIVWATTSLALPISEFANTFTILGMSFTTAVIFADIMKGKVSRLKMKKLLNRLPPRAPNGKLWN